MTTLAEINNAKKWKAEVDYRFRVTRLETMIKEKEAKRNDKFQEYMAVGDEIIELNQKLYKVMYDHRASR